MPSRWAILLGLCVALVVAVPASSLSLPASQAGALGTTWSLWLPAAIRDAGLPRPGPTSTVTPGLTVRGHVRLGSPSGAGLAGVDINMYFASYAPGDVVAVSDEDGAFETAFFYIPHDEMVTVWPELDGHIFDPPQYYWRHYGGVEHAVRDFVAHAVTPTPTETATATATATTTPTATPTTEPTVWDCSYNRYNCGDFEWQWQAQQCYDYCLQLVGTDVHYLDADKDGVACESLP